MDNITALQSFAILNNLDVVTYDDLDDALGEKRTCAVFDPEDPVVFAFINESDELFFIDEDFVPRQIAPSRLAVLQMIV